jgi:hypothetical protein
MSSSYVTTVYIERTVEIEVQVHVVPDEPTTWWEPGCAGEAHVQEVHMDCPATLDPAEEKEAIQKAIQQGPPEGPPDDGPPNDNDYNHPF